MEVDMLNKNAAVAQPVNYARYTEVETAPKKVQKIRQGDGYEALNSSTYDSISAVAYEGADDDGIKKAAPEEQQQERKGSSELLDKAISEANKKLVGYNRQFEYSVHEVTKDIMIKVVDTETHEIVKEIPPKKTLDAIAKMWELAGILIDEKK